MILIYSHTNSPRLQYICAFIFKEQLGIDFKITTNEDEFKSLEGAKINYSNKDIPGNFKIESTTLLFEKGINQQKIECFQAEGHMAFFKISNSGISFDIFAASFYLLSRYEEYLPHEIDMYGRYAHENSLAFKEGFLNQPLINIWLKDFSCSLKAVSPTLNFKLLTFNFLPTYDIDIAWSYKNKGLVRNVGGFLKSPSIERINVLLGLKNDPFDAYDFLDALHKEKHLHPIYFFLVAAGKSKYDKNIARDSKPMLQLIQRHVKKYSIGLHPSWKSHNDTATLKNEKNYLEDVCEISINNSRQHYIKFSLPETFELLIDAGIINDYSMGYGSINGFRASVASSFYWYDLLKEKQTGLRIHPFCYMDANSYFEQHFNATEAYEELLHYCNTCKKVNGQMITIFHNNFLGTEKKFKGWKDMYVKFISTAAS